MKVAGWPTMPSASAARRSASCLGDLAAATWRSEKMRAHGLDHVLLGMGRHLLEVGVLGEEKEGEQRPVLVEQRAERRDDLADGLLERLAGPRDRQDALARGRHSRAGRSIATVSPCRGSGGRAPLPRHRRPRRCRGPRCRRRPSARTGAAPPSRCAPWSGRRPARVVMPPTPGRSRASLFSAT